MSRVIVVGVGSPYGEDKLGWEVVRQLRLNPKIQGLSAQNVVIHCADRPGIDLLNVINQTNTVLIIDAAVSDFPPGTITRLEKNDIEALLKNTYTSSHDFGVLQTIALGKALNQLPEKIVVLGITVANENVVQDSFGNKKLSLSQAHMNRFIDIIIDELENLVREKADFSV